MCYLLMGLFLLLLAAEPGKAAAKGEWPMPAHDARLSARAEVPCNMPQVPREAWSYDVGKISPRWAMTADVDDDGRPEILYGPAPLVCADMKGREKWRAACGQVVAVADLDGDGQTEIVADGPVVISGRDGSALWSRTGPGYVLAYRTHVGKLLPDRKGLQIACVSEQYENNYAQLWSFDGGARQAKLEWEREFNKGPVYAHATSAAGRFDEKTMCVAAAVHGGLVVMDARDGKDLFRLYWQPHPGMGVVRNYGSLCIRDLDGDGKSEFVFLNDLIAVQMGVISPARGPAGEAADQNKPVPAPDVAEGTRAVYPEGPLRWRRYFGEWYPQGKPTLHIPPFCIADVDGDGQQEIVVSLHLDGWQLKVYNALTGQQKASVPGLYAHAVTDLDGDGMAEIVASEEPARTPREHTMLVIGNCLQEGWRQRFRQERCRLEGTDSPLWPPDYAGRNLDQKAPVYIENRSGRTLLLTTDDNGDSRADRLLALSLAPGKSAAGRSDRLDAKEGVRVLACAGRNPVAVSEKAEMLALNRSGRKIASWPCGSPAVSGVSAADINGDGSVELVMCRAERQVAALAGPFEAGEAPHVLWTVDGWGFLTSGKYGPAVLTADVNGDGRQEILTACLAGEGGVGVQLIGADGKILWKTPIPGAMETRLYPVITRALFADLDGDDHLDVYVSARLAMTGNDASQSFGLSGRDGKILWHNDASDPVIWHHTMGPTGMPAAADVNGDGRQDILFVTLDLCTELSGRDGSFLHTPLIPNEIWQQQNASTQWTAYGTQLPADLDGDGKPEILLCGGWGQFGAWTMDRKLLWTADPGREEHAYMLPGIADVDGDGKLEIGMIHLGGAFRCYEAATGRLKWEVRGLKAYTDVVCADVDGDGRPEFLLGLAAVKAVDSGSGKILWEGQTTRSPAVADIDGDGLGEIVAGGEDGKVRIFK
ncbi:MAG: VCBS repeat-containing protein [Armatimonadetes bacterium]|nr:VCBS repeat-containing protein [Armatimonadota bacterium]